jgi:hypothetical protein
MQLYDSRTSPIRRLDEIVMGAQAHRTYLPQLRPAKFSEQALLKGGAGAAGKGKEESANRTPNGLVRDRYLDVTEQVRRMPVGVVLLIDQEHVPELLASLTNSRLRLQIAQIGWHHFRGTLPPPATVGAAAKGKGAEAEAEQHGNLIELSVYCVASLYEKYRPGTRVAAPPVPATSPPPKTPPTPPPAQPAPQPAKEDS